jgi:hypothetical protein
MSDSGDHHNTLLQKLHDEVGHNFPRMFLDFNEYGVIATMLLESYKVSQNMFSEYSEFGPINLQINQALDAAILASASQGGKMRNSFLINRYQAVQTLNMAGAPQGKPGFFDGIDKLFGKGGNNNSQNVGQNDMQRLA